MDEIEKQDSQKPLEIPLDKEVPPSVPVQPEKAE